MTWLEKQFVLILVTPNSQAKLGRTAAKHLLTLNPLHRGAFYQFPFRRIYYYGSNEFTGKETGKTQLCALGYLGRATCTKHCQDQTEMN